MSVAACGAQPSEAARATGSPVGLVQAAPSVAPVDFGWADLQGKPLSGPSMRGRVTVLGFVTTYDVASQAQVRFLQRLHRHHTPRLNAGLVVLEQPENRPMVEAFASALELPFPVAMADAATIRGDGPFRGLHHVPSIVILDRDGRERVRHLGLVELPALEEMVRRVEDETGVKRRGAI